LGSFAASIEVDDFAETGISQMNDFHAIELRIGRVKHGAIESRRLTHSS
jgi:hypothetical protein